MEIAQVKTVPLSIPLEEPKSFALKTVKKREYVIVRIITEEGLEGWGYTWGPVVISKIINQLLGDVILGEDPRKIEKLWDKMYQSTMVWGRRGLIIRAISAVDIALWDLLGKIADQPIYRLLGSYRDKVPAYYSGGYYLKGQTSLSDYVDYIEEEVEKYYNKGFNAFKIKIGGAKLQTDLRRIEKVREIVGDGVQLMLDANCAWDLNSALNIIGKLEQYDPVWIEEPLKPDKIDTYRQLRNKTSVPVATGENHFTRWEFKQLIEKEGVDYIQGDPIIMGGISEFKKLAGMVSSEPIKLAPHNSHNINIHMGAGLKEVEFLEYFDFQSDIFNFDCFIKNPIKPDDSGFLQPLERPGHGLLLDHEALDNYKI